MPRERIAMSPTELRDFLAAQAWVVLGTLDPDGTPVGDVVPAVLDGDHLRVAVLRGSRAHENIGRDARIACAADEFPSYYEIRGVTVHGRAEVVPSERLGPEWIEYTVGLDDVASFDFRKIARKH